MIRELSDSIVVRLNGVNWSGPTLDEFSDWLVEYMGDRNDNWHVYGTEGHGPGDAYLIAFRLPEQATMFMLKFGGEIVDFSHQKYYEST